MARGSDGQAAAEAQEGESPADGVEGDREAGDDPEDLAHTAAPLGEGETEADDDDGGDTPYTCDGSREGVGQLGERALPRHAGGDGECVTVRQQAKRGEQGDDERGLLHERNS